jgi:hypothetical protein
VPPRRLLTYLLTFLLVTTHDSRLATYYRHHLDETLNTLQYASRAKNIQNRPVVQLDAQVSQQVSQQLQASFAQQLRLLQVSVSSV